MNLIVASIPLFFILIGIEIVAARLLERRVYRFADSFADLGCGMIDPEVFRHVGYDPDRYSGFAAGLGLDRFALLKYDVDDIQLLFQGDVRFLRQFR